MKIDKVGIAWYRESEYLGLKALFTDGDDMHDTFDEWLQQAEEGVRMHESMGSRVFKVIIGLKSFPGWCLVRGLDANAQARSRFASEYVMRASGD